MADNMDDIMNSDEKYEPTAKELLEMLDSADLDEETRQSLRSLLGGDVPQFFGGTGSGTLLAITFAALIFSIILFFGYKLYKSIKEKEKKKEEKKKLKQMKKKK